VVLSMINDYMILIHEIINFNLFASLAIQAKLAKRLTGKTDRTIIFRIAAVRTHIDNGILTILRYRV
jgi:hypothetical protein